MVNDNGIDMFPGGKYLLDGYQTLREPIYFKDNNGKEYSLQYYQKKHKHECLIQRSDGSCYLYKNGLLQMVYKQENGKRKGDFVSLEKGRISFIQDSDNILNTNRWIRKVNDKRGELSEIWEGGRMVYRGKLNRKNKREGIGLAYDKECDVEYEGVFKNDECIQILKIFEGDEMIELLDNDNNVDVSNQIPVYAGGWKIDDNSEYIRDGIGYLIDIDKRIAYAEVFYENGSMIKRKELFDGWYHENRSSPIAIDTYPKSVSMPSKYVTISNSTELITLTVLVTNLVISSNCGNDVDYFDFSRYVQLKSIEVGDNCFENVSSFTINGLKRLRSIEIGKYSFTKEKSAELFDNEDNVIINRCRKRRFQILNCDELQTIKVGEYSFSDYGGDFILKNLPSLSLLKIGEVDKDSYNFYFASFIVEDLPALLTISLGNVSFSESITTIISNLPSLEDITLGNYSLNKKDDSTLTMQNLPKLKTFSSIKGSFQYTNSVMLLNIPNVRTVNLPLSFQSVSRSSIENVHPKLKKLVTVRNSVGYGFSRYGRK